MNARTKILAAALLAAMALGGCFQSPREINVNIGSGGDKDGRDRPSAPSQLPD